jgi:CheY-like chemotaxis protein
VIQAQNTVSDELPLRYRRVLVAEDSPVTQDLLKLILTQRGHEVDIADDGEQALSALRKHPYDVALIDFRLPKLDGLQVAQQYRADKNGSVQARLIAITADVEGLLSHKENCENFDQIIPKPLDIYEICNVIEQVAAIEPSEPDAGAKDATRSAQTGGKRMALGNGAASARTAEPAWATGLELLRWPDDFDQSRFTAAGYNAATGDLTIDAILIKGAARLADVEQIWERKQLHLFPIIDLGGELGPHADLDASRLHYGSGEAVRGLVQSFHQRRGELHRDLTMTADLGEKLLGRMFVSNQKLTAAYDTGEASLICYNLPLGNADVVREAEKQCKNGFLQREFFDRFHFCYRCGSSRMHVREECPECRSPELREEQYMHHFRCAYQGIESDFRRGDKLICPKCRQALSHFSVDYDKPGAVMLCGRCRHTSSEPAIGFVCLDCSAHVDSDAAAAKDAFSYVLTEEGTAFLQMGRALRGPTQQTMRFSDLPLDFVVALNGAAKTYNETRTPFTVLNLSYENEREIVRETGMRQFSQARDLFLENLRNLLREKGIVIKGRSYDFCLLAGLPPADAEGSVADIRSEATAGIRLDLGVKIRVFGPEDFA